MAKRYRLVERDQVFLLPVSMREWLSSDHPVWLVIRAVERMDTRAFHDVRRLGGAGAPAYDPDMLLTVLVWAYAHQVTSSRRVEELCGTDVAFRVICGGNLPDHVTIARFRAGFGAAITSFLAEVLALCAALGMGRVGVVALDGTKIAANASGSANRTEEHLRKLAAETVAAHARADAEEDDLFGPGRRGDEVPEDAWSPRSRDERIAAALASLRREREAAEAEKNAQASSYLAKAQAGRPGRGMRPAGADVAAARLRLEQVTAAKQAMFDAWHQRNEQKIAATGRGIGGYAPVPPADNVMVRRARVRLARAQARAAAMQQRAAEREQARRGPGSVRNITDPDSRLMPVRGGGFIQGYNAQLVTSEDGLIIAAKLTNTPGDVTWLKPMMTSAQAAAALITARQPAPGPACNSDGAGWRAAGYQPPGQDDQPGYAGPIGLLLADAGYCSEANITTPGPPRLIATGKHRDLEQAARSPGSPAGSQRGQHTIAMTALLQTEDGITAYRHRGHIAETPNGDIKHNKRFRQLSVRGLAKASAEITLTAATCNLLKAISTGHLTHTALDELTTQAGYLAAT
jgi:transposase